MSFQGCATHREIYFADGTKGYSVNCSGSEMNFSHCLEKAGEICNTRGYNILNQNGIVIPFSVAVHDLKKNPYSPSFAFIPAGYNGVKNQKTAGAILTSKNIKTITLLKTIGNRKLNLNQIKSKVGKNIAVRFLNLFF